MPACNVRWGVAGAGRRRQAQVQHVELDEPRPVLATGPRTLHGLGVGGCQHGDPSLDAGILTTGAFALVREACSWPRTFSVHTPAPTLGWVTGCAHACSFELCCMIGHPFGTWHEGLTLLGVWDSCACTAASGWGDCPQGNQHSVLLSSVQEQGWVLRSSGGKLCRHRSTHPRHPSAPVLTG